MKHLHLIGDSIRIGYMNAVAAELSAVATITWPEPNCGPTDRIIENLQEWTVDQNPDIIHLNAGLHDVRRTPDVNAPNQIALDQYKANLRTIFQTITDAGITLIWCTTTPVNEHNHNTTKPMARLNADIDTYNAAALQLASEFQLPVHDLHATVLANDPDTLLRPDGVHYTPEANVLLGKAVATYLRPHLV